MKQTRKQKLANVRNFSLGIMSGHRTFYRFRGHLQYRLQPTAKMHSRGRDVIKAIDKFEKELNAQWEKLRKDNHND